MKQKTILSVMITWGLPMPTFKNIVTKLHGWHTWFYKKGSILRKNTWTCFFLSLALFPKCCTYSSTSFQLSYSLSWTKIDGAVVVTNIKTKGEITVRFLTLKHSISSLIHIIWQTHIRKVSNAQNMMFKLYSNCFKEVNSI